MKSTEFILFVFKGGNDANTMCISPSIHPLSSAYLRLDGGSNGTPVTLSKTMSGQKEYVGPNLQGVECLPYNGSPTSEKGQTTTNRGDVGVRWSDKLLICGRSYLYMWHFGEIVVGNL